MGNDGSLDNRAKPDKARRLVLAVLPVFMVVAAGGLTYFLTYSRYQTIAIVLAVAGAASGIAMLALDRGTGDDSVRNLPPDIPLDRSALKTFLHMTEPGGIDDVDTWLMTAVAMLPISAIVSVIVGYSLSNDGFFALFIGLAVAVDIFVWLLYLYVWLGFDTARHASVDTYNDLCQRMERVWAVPRLAPATDTSLAAAAAAAYDSVSEEGKAFWYARRKRGLHWILGKGYVDLARTVHRAEEAVLLYELVDLAVAEGLRDQARISGSTIPRRDELLNHIRRALVELSPAMALYLAQLPPHSATIQARPAARLGIIPRIRGQRGGGSLPAISTQTQARIMLRDARYGVNDFRDTRRAGLIDARNDLLTRMFLTGLATALLLIFIIAGHPPISTLLTGAVLYAIGATVGLFSRLRADADASVFAEDYGIAYVRLFQTFLLSGLAAVAGVYIAIVLPLALNTPVLQPVAASETPTATARPGTLPRSAPAVTQPGPRGKVAVPTPGTPTASPSPTIQRTPGSTTPGGDMIPRLTEIYDIERYPFDIVLAMIFGLAPGLVVSRLSQSVEQFKLDLRSSEQSNKLHS